MSQTPDDPASAVASPADAASLVRFVPPERVPNPEVTIARLTTELAEERRQLLVERARRLHPIPDDFVEFLTGRDETTLLMQASRLSAHALRLGETE